MPKDLAFPLKLRCQYHAHGAPDGVIVAVPDTSPASIAKLDNAWPRSCECWGELRDARGRFAPRWVVELATANL